MIQSLLPNRYLSVAGTYATLLETLTIVPWFRFQY